MKNKQEAAADIIKKIISDGKEHTSRELKQKVKETMRSFGYTQFHNSWYYNGLAILIHSGIIKRDGEMIKPSSGLLTKDEAATTLELARPAAGDRPKRYRNDEVGQDKELITKCINGLELYAALQAQKDAESPQIADIRDLIWTLAGYWGLDTGENAKPVDYFMNSFDTHIEDAKAGKEVPFYTSKISADVLGGLYLHGSEMIVCQRDSAIYEILSVNALMKEIAEAWSSKSRILDELTGHLESEVWAMLPGQRESGGSVGGYDVRQAVTFDDNQGFALAQNTAESPPFMVWRFLDQDGVRDYHMAHCFETEAKAVRFFASRAADYSAEHGVKIVDAHPTADTAVLIDPSVTQTDMYAYGYSYEGMIPLGKERAFELFDKGCQIFRLQPFDSERVVVNRADIEAFTGLFGIIDPEKSKQARSASIEVFILNRARYESGEAVGEWLTLPTDADTFRGLLERIGIEKPSEDVYSVTAIRLPFDCLSDYVTKHNSLDELNMLASYIGNTEEYELDKLQAILTSDVMYIGEGITALVNVLYDDNMDAFNVIDAKDAEALGRYYAEEKPYNVSFEEYGRQIAGEEKGVFTEWGYIYFRYKELLPAYIGSIPDEYRIVDKALHGLRSDTPKYGQSSESVLDQIRTARKAPRVPNDRATRQNKQEKGGTEL